MGDRRRVNGPAGATQPPVFAASSYSVPPRQERSRKPNELRKIFLQTGLVPSAAGSAYLELPSSPSKAPGLLRGSSTIKLSCSIHGPKPLPRTASFSPNLQLSASVKLAPFATHVRQGYVPNSVEKDLGLHLENALKGVILPDRWPKSAIDVAVTILEGEDDHQYSASFSGLSLYNLLAAAINVSMAALSDARIDCLGVLSAGVGAITSGPDGKSMRILDPAAIEHEELKGICVIGYLPGRDEIVEMWSSNTISGQGKEGSVSHDDLVDSAIAAAKGAHTVLSEVLLESLTMSQAMTKKSMSKNELNDVEMKT